MSEVEGQSTAEKRDLIEVRLSKKGPYLFPRMPALEGVLLSKDESFELHLKTGDGKRVRLPIALDQLAKLKRLVDQLDAIKNKK